MCNSNKMKSLGRLPNSNYFANTLYVNHIPSSVLNLCINCESLQRDPVQPQEFYSSMYESAKSRPWTGKINRLDHPMVASMINLKDSNKNILDIGCGDGAFLEMLPDHIKKFAIEPSPNSRMLLESKNIEVISDDISNIDNNQKYDVITIIDVIEHMVNPKELLLKASNLLNDGGFIIISSGNPQEKVWVSRLKNRFWYCFCQEHITFPSRKILNEIANSAGLREEEYETFQYIKISILRKIVGTAIQEIYRYCRPIAVVTMAFIQIGRHGFRWDDYIHLMGAGRFSDHHMILYRKT